MKWRPSGRLAAGLPKERRPPARLTRRPNISRPPSGVSNLAPQVRAPTAWTRLRTFASQPAPPPPSLAGPEQLSRSII